MKLEIYNKHAGIVLSNKNTIYQLFLDFGEKYVRKNNPKRLTIGFPIVNHWFWSHFGGHGSGTYVNFSPSCLTRFYWIQRQNDRMVKLYYVKKYFPEIRNFSLSKKRYLDFPTYFPLDMRARGGGTSKKGGLGIKFFEFRENIFLHNRVLPYDHFAKGIKEIGLYNAEKSLYRSQNNVITVNRYQSRSTGVAEQRLLPTSER